jgi:hypothetical protein
MILPGHPEYYPTLNIVTQLATIQSLVSVIRPGNSGLPEAVTNEQLKEYILGGEYDVRLNEIGEDDDDDC